jgi:DNA-cytosine methyltransferase
MRHIGLFEGIGGFSLAARWAGWETIAWCEWNEFGQKVLRHHFQEAKGHGNICEADFTIYRGQCDIVTGGFPCQDASNANQSESRGKGTDGERTGLVREMFRAIEEIRPKYVVAENVANILKVNGGRDFGEILSTLARMGYNAEWRVCRSSEKGAPHHRARCYLVAYPNSIRIEQGETFIPHVREKIEPVGWRAHGTVVQVFRSGKWKSEPPTVCLDNGISGKLVRDSIKAYGNAVSPDVPLSIFQAINQYEESLK